MECILCNNEINMFDTYYKCPICGATYCEDEKEMLGADGDLCPSCHKGFVDEYECTSEDE